MTDNIEINELIAKANSGDDKAQHLLACYYKLGYGVEVNPELSFKYCMMASKAGNLDAIRALGYDYKDGFGTLHSNEKAIICFKYLIGKKYNKAIEDLADLYLAMYEYPNAIKYFKMLKKYNEAKSLYGLGFCRLYGYGIRQNVKKAIKLLEKSAGLGNVDSKVLLIASYETFPSLIDSSNFDLWADDVYKSGDEVSIEWLAEIFTNRGEHEKAFRFYSLAASKCNPEAEQALIECYITGRGCQKDVKKAIEMYEPLVEYGVPGAALIAECYENGDGVEQNFEKAFEWYMRGAEYGDEACIEGLVRCYEHGVGVVANSAEAKKWRDKLSV